MMSYHLIADPTLPKCPECSGSLYILVDNTDETIACRDCGEEWQTETEVRSYIRKTPVVGDKV